MIPNQLDHEWYYFDDVSDCLDLLPIKSKKLSEKFDQIVLEIIKVVECVERDEKSRYTLISKKRHSSPISNPKNYFKRLIYQFGSHYYEHRNKKLRATLNGLLIGAVEKHGGRILTAKNSYGSDNLFYLCFRAMDPNENIVKRGEISRLSKQLLFAYKNEVPQEYLIGYIYQTGGQQVDLEKELSDKENWDFSESEFEHSSNIIDEDNKW